ncbi:Hsp20 family protein [Thalassotalea ponticola]|uniref:Hsp20 family protein n=1 Tax=Thalassotalea ponticola TaxID=1523392 RepID=UPI0025B5646E|nr:Hsp20 family protein [Thalassotalea ponticola]MDN3653217.1 Hsp20 family protein [Thalassotalea ponticola]
MRTLTTDFSPLYRSFIGAEHLASLMDQASRSEKQSAYPPYNIESIADDKYRITMAVAGFVESELDIESHENSLTVTGTKTRKEDEQRTYLYQGIADRNFERKFQLADHVKVVNAYMENGLLHIELVREIPEALKPRKIAINGKNLLESTTN